MVQQIQLLHRSINGSTFNTIFCSFSFVFARVWFASFSLNRLWFGFLKIGCRSPIEWWLKLTFIIKSDETVERTKEFFLMKSSGRLLHYWLRYPENTHRNTSLSVNISSARLKCEMLGTTTFVYLIHSFYSLYLNGVGDGDLSGLLLLLMLWCCRGYFAFFGFCWSLPILCLIFFM